VQLAKADIVQSLEDVNFKLFFIDLRDEFLLRAFVVVFQKLTIQLSIDVRHFE